MIVQKAWDYFLDCLRYARLVLRSAASGRGRDKPVALVRMRSIRQTRRFSQACFILSSADFAVKVRCSLRDFRGMNSYGRKALEFPGVSLALRASARARDLLVVDEGRSEGKTLMIDYDPYSALAVDDGLFLPIMLHPNLLGRAAYEEAARLRSRTARAMRIFFAGSISEGYSKPIVAGGRSLLNRREVILPFVSGVSGAELAVPASLDEFHAGLDNGRYANSFVIVDTERFDIPTGEWLSTLAKADFFVAPPGYMQPYCHNLVEAMAVGTVPVFQFPDLFRPPLRDGLECLAFEDAAGLARIVDSILRGKLDASIEGMRRAAAAYHDSYLHPDAAARRIRAFMEDPAANELRLYLAGGKAAKLMGSVK
jgi:hypothetical protein